MGCQPRPQAVPGVASPVEPGRVGAAFYDQRHRLVGLPRHCEIAVAIDGEKNIGAARDGRDPASRAGAHSAGERVRVDRQPDPPTMPTIAAIPSGKLCSSSRMRLGPGIMGRCRPPVVNPLSDSPFVEGCMLATPPKTTDGTRRQSLPGGALFGGARQLKEP